jgi:hypothetical protein
MTDKNLETEIEFIKREDFKKKLAVGDYILFDGHCDTVDIGVIIKKDILESIFFRNDVYYSPINLSGQRTELRKTNILKVPEEVLLGNVSESELREIVEKKEPLTSFLGTRVLRNYDRIIKNYKKQLAEE